MENRLLTDKDTIFTTETGTNIHQRSIRNTCYSNISQKEIDKCIDFLLKAQDAKSYQAGREIAAKEIFAELKKYDATLRMGTAVDGYFHYEYKKLSELLQDFKSRFLAGEVKEN
jgi:hypothetical protein